MSVDVIFRGGPADGIDMVLIGKLPPYLMVMLNPSSESSMSWIIVGAGFDDNWPGQHRYNLDLIATHLLIVGGDHHPSGEAVYVYEEAT